MKIYLKHCRFLKADLSGSPTWAEFCQLIASLSVVLSRLNLTKLKHEHLKFGLKCKKRKMSTQTKFFLHHSSSTFFSVQLKFAFRIKPLKVRCSVFQCRL